MEIEQMSGDRSETINESLAWAKREKHIEEYLEKEGIHTLYCCQQNRGKTVTILDNKGLVSLMVGGKVRFSSRNLDYVVRWGRAAGYIGKTEKITRR